MIELSIIIPISPQEDLLNGLLKDLKNISLKNSSEIILIGASDISIPEDSKKYFVKSSIGRAVQLNNGAQGAKGKFLWFLHADSRISRRDFNFFYQNLVRYPNALSYFNLKFYPSSKKLVLNEIGARFRSDLIKFPFGDQGLGVSKENFDKLGGFPQVPMGEDIGFVFKARKLGIKLRNNGAYIYTSSRKYEKNGWMKTTVIHLFYTIKLFLSFWLNGKTI